MNRIFVREMKMPLTIRAYTVPDANGDFNIYLNEALSEEAKKKSLEHEKKHITRNDFSSKLSVKLIETTI